MKLAINFKLSITLFFLIFIVFVAVSTTVDARPLNFASPQNNLAVECVGNQANTNFLSEDTENRSTLTRPGEYGCEMAPFSHKVTFYRLDICTAAPTGPTTSAAADISNCTTFYRNDAGDEAVILNGQGSLVGSFDNFTRLNEGTYTHAVVTIGSTVKFTQTANFDGAMTVGGISGSGATRCVTKVPLVSDASGGPSNVLYGNEDRNVSEATSNVICSDTVKAVETQIGYNIIMRNEANNACIHARTFNFGRSIADAYLAETDGTLHDGVSNDEIANDENGCRAGRADGITRVVGVLHFNTPLVVTDSTFGIQMDFNNTRALWLQMNNGSYEVNRFDTGMFDFNLSPLNLTLSPLS